MTKEEQVQRLISEQMVRDRNIMVTYLLASCIVVECMDQLSGTNTPFKWIAQETKAAFNHFDKTFKKKHDKNINELFNVTDSIKQEGEVFINTQEFFRHLLEDVGKELSKKPLESYPEILMKIAESGEATQSVIAKLNSDEGEE